MDALQRANEDHALGYGSDKWTDEAVAMLKESFTPACESLFVFTVRVAILLLYSLWLDRFTPLYVPKRRIFM
jgi:threonine aldolase